MRTIQRLLSVSFVVLSLAAPLHAAVIGTVINIDGKAIAGAKVSLFAPEPIAAQGPRLLSAEPQRKALVTGTTDSGGKFNLDVPKDQVVVALRVEAAGYAPAGGGYAADDDAGAILLTQAPSVRGTITAAGKPVANATVALFGGGGNGEYTAKTDTEGHYSAPDPSKWAIRAIVLHPDYAILDELIGPNAAKKGPDFSMNAGVSVAGRVVSEDGQTPAADTQIFVDGWPAGKSAADGSFTIAHAKREWENVEARVGNRVAQRARKAGTSPTLKLAKGGTVSGSVRDVKSQLPIAGVRVALAPSGAFGSREAAHDTITDAKGNFTIAPIVAGTYDVRPTRPGYTVNGAQALPVKGAEAVQKALYGTARGRISGTVVDEDKRPVAAARLSAATVGRNGMFGIVNMMRGGGGSDGYSAPDGHFVLRNVETDADLQVDAVKRGYPAAKSPSLKLAAGERKTGVTLTILRGLLVTGRVTDKDKKPLSGTGVEAIEASNDPMGGMRRVVMNMQGNRNDELVRTGSDGTFSIRVKEGTYDLAFKREGYSAKTVRGTKVDANTKPVEVVLDPGVEISGRVTRSGVGVEGVNVRAMSQGGMGAAVTGPDGAFRISDLTPGQMMLIAAKQDSFIQEMRPITAPAQDVIIDLPSGGRITGRVVDKSSHQPVTSFMAGVTTSRSGGGMVMMMPPMQRQFTSDDGTFVLEGIKPGSTQVVVNAPGYTTARVANIEVEDGKTTADIEVGVETGAKLTGRITGPDGSPVAGVSVREDQMAAGASRVMRFDATETSGTSDPNGDYSIDTLEPGEKTFTFARSGYIAQQKTVTIAGSKETRLDVQLSNGLRATGSVVTDGGAPVPDATVRAASASEMDGGRQATTDGNGAFTIEALAPGHYTFTASKSGFAPGTLRDIDIASSGPVRVILKSGGVITGHVNGLTPQELEQTTVSASVSGGGGGPFGGGGPGVSAAVDGGGNFRLEGAPSGTVRVSARTGAMFGGSSKSAAPKTVELEPGGTAQVDIDFKSSTVIQGRIMRNNAPVANAQVTFIPRGAKSQTVSSASSDANGHYEVSSLDDGTYSVQVVDMARLSPFATQYEVHGSSTFDITIKTVTVRGRVVDATDTHPLNEATVDLRQTGGQSIFGGGGGQTDADGRFTIENVAAGTYQITADKSGYGHDSRQITIGDSSPDEVQFQLSPSDGIIVRAVDTRDNTPLTVNVLRVVDAQGIELPSSSGFFGNSSETVKLSLAPGVYKVTVMARNYAPQTLSMPSPSQQVVRFSPGGTLILHSKESTTRRARLIDAAGVTHGLNPISQGISLLPPGATQINNIAGGHYTLQILDNTDRVTKTVEIDVIDGQQKDYDV
ncbi:MAG: large repetitive protein [Thermoanaerobaculia bacterium]|jgi:protocatechuate 3,4-dioxygenase beta subunit|nr:large repetitive protein [Thermoanaerobaculia bacterium]